MSNTIIATVFSSGVRRIRPVGMAGLGGWASVLGASPDIVSAMITDLYDPAIINSLSNAGATDAQMQNLWDNYGAGTPEFAFAANALMQQLTGKPGATGGAGYPTGAIPQIQTNFGMWDLSLVSTWNQITNLFSTIGAGLNAAIAQTPNDPTAIQMRSQYNSLVNQFNSAWANLFTTGSGIKTLGDWTNVAVDSGIVILGGIAIASGVGIPLVATVAAIAAGLWTLQQWIATRQTQATTAQIQTTGNAANAASLTSTYNQLVAAANAATNPTTKAGLLAQANQTLAAIQGLSAPPAAPFTNWTAWFQQNFGLIAAALAIIVIVPTALRRV